MTAEVLALRPRPVLREAAFLRYVAGQAVSIVGDQVWYIALSWAAVQLTDAKVAGLIMAVSSVPRIALILFGGALVDRYGPRRLMIRSDLLRAVISLVAAGLALGLGEGGGSVALLVAVALVFGLADAVFLPAAGSMLPRLLQPEQFSQGNAVNTLAARAALTLGAPLGGALVVAGGLPLACLVNAVTFVISVIALWSVHPRQSTVEAAKARDPLGESLKQGLRYLSRQRLLGSLMIVVCLTNLGFVGPMNLGLALLSDQRGWGAGGIGAMLSGFGAGACVGGLSMIWIKPKRHIGWLLAAGALVEGIGILVPVTGGTLSLAVASSVLIGLVSGPMAVLMASLSQANTDDAYRGRVSSVSSLVNLGLVPLTIGAMGWAAGQYGLLPTTAVCAALEVAAALTCLGVAELRRATLR